MSGPEGRPARSAGGLALGRDGSRAGYMTDGLIAEGDKVVRRNTVTGTHQGEYMGLPPTGKSVTYNEIFIVRFAAGRIAET